MIKIKALPFLAGIWAVAYFNQTFTIAGTASLIMVLLVLTKQVDLY